MIFCFDKHSGYVNFIGTDICIFSLTNLLSLHGISGTVDITALDGVMVFGILFSPLQIPPMDSKHGSGLKMVRREQVLHWTKTMVVESTISHSTFSFEFAVLIQSPDLSTQLGLRCFKFQSQFFVILTEIVGEI